MKTPHYHPDKPSLRLIKKEKQQCEQCDTLQLCLNAWLDKELIHDIGQITMDRGTFQTGQAIYRMEDRFRSLLIVQSGSIKVERILENGIKHVNGFYFCGDLFGLDSIGNTLCGYDAIALETTRICEISYDQLALLSSSIPRLQKMVISLLGNKVHQTNNRLIDSRYLSAESRLLLFLKGVCERNLIQIKSNNGRLHLPMTKTDIASYLGMRPESVSRALTNLQRQGVIRNNLKYIEINDINAAMQAICKS